VSLSGAVVEAGVYRWVDENGKVHYGDRPGAAEDAAEIQIKQNKTTTSSAPDAAERAETRQRLLEQYETERLQKREAAAKKKAEAKKREKNCAIAKNRLRIYKSSALYEDGPDGERRYLSDAEYEKALAKARADVERWCD
jgi:hypothetical protein